VFDNWHDFSEHYDGNQIDRYKRLCPPWVFSPLDSEKEFTPDLTSEELANNMLEKIMELHPVDTMVECTKDGVFLRLTSKGEGE
jgi:hypothetical protein